MLVVICGRPCVGKTTTALALAQFFAELGKVAVVINEESQGIIHTEGYLSQ